MSEKSLRFAMFGAGFWSGFQLSAWYETGGAECVAICDPVRAKAERLAARFNVPAVYEDAATLLANEQIDFMDIVTNVETHFPLAKLGAEHGVSVVVQKPMTVSLDEAETLVKLCDEAGVKFFVNENWRWQTPMRALKNTLDTGRIGKPFRARFDYRTNFPVFDNQPALKELDQFILTDIGSHLLDAARFLFGEATTLYCHTARIHTDIKGEDVATVMMTMGEGVTVVCVMSFATRREFDRFPETYVEIEGDKGFLELGPDFWIRETTDAGTLATRHVPPRYAWADPVYDIAQSSAVPCQANLLEGLRGGHAETTGADNLKTMTLIAKSYESAATGRLINLTPDRS